MTDFVQGRLDFWAEAVESLSGIGRQEPQAAYAGLTKSLQNEWLYLLRVTPAIGDMFEHLEGLISEAFLPALFGTSSVTGHLRRLSTLPIW